jgi:putative transposase
MATPLVLLAALRHCVFTAMIVFLDLGRLIAFGLRSRRAVAAENLFLRKQMALFQERKIKPRRAHDATRWMMATLSRMFPWRDALWNVKPDTLIRWCRKGFRLFWRWKSKPTGRPSLPKELRQLIREMAAGNATWGEERIANELKLKLGIGVSPRSVGKYLRVGGPVRSPDAKQRWPTFVRNHAQAIAACDFFVVVTATFRNLYVFVVMDLGTRRILHHNVTAHPTAEWTTQQFREALPGGHAYQFVIHDRDSIFFKELKDIIAMGVRVLRTPFRAPTSNSFCERFGGTLRRECLDFLIPFNERHLKLVLNSWIAHFNHARPHMSLGPGIPAALRPLAQESSHRHRIPAGNTVRRAAVLGGLHHEYWLEEIAA